MIELLGPGLVFTGLAVIAYDQYRKRQTLTSVAEIKAEAKKRE